MFVIESEEEQKGALKACLFISKAITESMKRSHKKTLTAKEIVLSCTLMAMKIADPKQFTKDRNEILEALKCKRKTKK